MALLNKTLGTREDSRNSEDEDDELEKLESDVMEMAQKILDYRATLPDQLRTTLASVLAAQRPVFPNGLEQAPSGGPISGMIHVFLAFTFCVTIFVKHGGTRSWSCLVAEKMGEKKSGFLRWSGVLNSRLMGLRDCKCGFLGTYSENLKIVKEKSFVKKIQNFPSRHIFFWY